MPSIWHLTHQTLKKPPPSSVLNAIIFRIDEQYNLIFETALFTNCKTYIIFLFRWGPLSFLLIIFFSFPFLLSLILALSQQFLYSLSPSTRHLCLLFDETQAGASSQANLYHSGFFFFNYYYYFFLRLWFDGRFDSCCVGYEFGILDLTFSGVVWCAPAIL